MLKSLSEILDPELLDYVMQAHPSDGGIEVLFADYSDAPNLRLRLVLREFTGQKLYVLTATNLDEKNMIVETSSVDDPAECVLFYETLEALMINKICCEGQLSRRRHEFNTRDRQLFGMGEYTGFN